VFSLVTFGSLRLTLVYVLCAVNIAHPLENFENSVGPHFWVKDLLYKVNIAHPLENFEHLYLPAAASMVVFVSFDLIRVCIYVHTYMYIRTYVYVYTYVRVCIYVCTYILLFFMYTYKCS